MNHLQILLFALCLTCLIMCAAFFSLAETALMAINRYRLRHKVRLKKRYAIRLLQLLKHPDRLLSVILFGSTFTIILASSLATLITFHFWGIKGALIAACLLTLIIGIFAEIAPKTLAAIYPERTAQWVVYPIEIILKLFYPFVWLANGITNGLLHLLHIRITQQISDPLTREELRSVVYDTKGKISRRYQHMLLSILDMNKLTVDDVMVPRRDILGIDIAAPWKNIYEEIGHLQQECVPIYRHDINQVVGVLYIRDVLHLLLAHKKLDQTTLEKLLKTPYFVPSGTGLNVQLEHFQQSQEKFAFVLDEYGDVQGMLTLNDILEEIVGDFTSSMSAAKRVAVQMDGSYLVDGAVTVREFNRTSEWELPLGGPKTVNGLIIEYLEALPQEKSSILIANYPIEIIQVKDNHVKQARIYPRLVKEDSEELS